VSGDLEDAKARIKARFLGRHGVHGVGLRPSEGSVVVYCDDPAAPETAGLRSQLEEAAAPHGVIMVAEPRAKLG
jgi:hypothetical protein